MKNSLQTLLSKTSLFMAFSVFASTSFVEAACNNACPLTINGQGSTLLAPWVEASAASYDAKTPSYTVTYNTNSSETGSGNGILQLQAGATFFGGTDVAPTCAQSVVQPPATCACASCPIGIFPNRILTFPVAIAGTAIGFNNTNETGTLTLAPIQLASIFTGATTNWSAFGLPAEPIKVVVRSDSSGDTNNFTTFLTDTVTPLEWPYGAVSVFPPGIPGFTYVSGNAAVAAFIEANPGSIGYLAYGYTQPPLSGTTAITVAAVENSNDQFITPSVASIGLAASGVCVPFDLSISTINSPTLGAYPIASPTNLIAYEYQPTACAACEVANWLYYMGTTAQSTAASFFLAPLPAAFQQQYLNNLSFIKECGAGNFIPGICTSETGRPPFGFTLVNNNVIENTDTNAAAAVAAAAAVNVNAKKSFNKNKKHKHRRSHSHSSR